MSNNKITFLTLLILLFLSGCSTTRNSMPVTQIEFDASQLERSEYVILDNVTGISSTQYILGGLIQIIDANYPDAKPEDKKVKFLGIRFYKAENYATQEPKGCLYVATTADRAYYKALSQSFDADSIIQQKFNRHIHGFPGIVQTEVITFCGKAIQLKSDADLYQSTNIIEAVE